MSNIQRIENGLVMAGQPTEDEYISAGMELAQEEKALEDQNLGLCWAIGDWYNSLIPGITGKEACRRAGLNWSTTKTLGRIAKAFPVEVESTQLLREVLGYARCDAIARLPEDQRQGLIDEVIKHGLTMRQTRQRVSDIKGKFSMAKAKTLGKEAYEELQKIVPQRHHGLLKNIMERIYLDIRNEVQKRTEAERDRLQKESKEYRRKTEKIESAQRKMKSNMSDEEYRLILQCLHPDKAPEGRKERFSKAFTAFRSAAEKAGMKTIRAA